MIINHIVQRREERRQRKARWMLSRCFTQDVQLTDIIIEEPLVIEEPIVIEPIVIQEEAIVIEVEPIVIEAKATVSTKHIDEAQVQSTSSMSEDMSEELRKLLILHQTIKKLSSKKSNLTLCI